jgi:exosortase O
MKLPATQSLFTGFSKFGPPRRIAGNLLLLLLWFWVYHPVFSYFGVIFTRQEFRTNQIVLAGALVMIALQARRGRLHLRMDVSPHLYYPALGMLVGGSLVFLIVERFLEVNTLSASAFGLASYGLLGLWMRPNAWRQGLPAALLLIGALPFGEHMETFVGYPVRILTATMVRDGLSAAGIHSIGIDTILVFENGISQVDIPCSGVKSLWTGSLFLLAATWIERRPINFRWLLVSLIFGVLLLAANLARVAVLVVVGQVAGWQMLAEMLHVPLGVIGFIAVCAMAVALLRRVQSENSERANTSAVEIPKPAWLVGALAFSFLILGLLYAPRPPSAAPQSVKALQFPAELQTEPMPLSQTELDWLNRDGAASAERWQFTWQEYTGSLLFVSSRTWRSQHIPERCFTVYGLTVENSYAYLAAPDFPIRVVSLTDEKNRSPYSAVYWYQSAERVTDDHATRIWADLQPEREQWVLATILFNGTADPDSSDLRALYTGLRLAIQRNLEGDD